MFGFEKAPQNKQASVAPEKTFRVPAEKFRSNKVDTLLEEIYTAIAHGAEVSSELIERRTELLEDISDIPELQSYIGRLNFATTTEPLLAKKLLEHYREKGDWELPLN
jgi:hypothetical protein